MSTELQSREPPLRTAGQEATVGGPTSSRWRVAWDTALAYRGQALRFGRFLVVGGLASAVYLSLTAVFMLAGAHYMYAAGAALAIAIGVNFTVNRQWTFSGRGVRRIHVQALSFLGVQIAVGAMNLALLNVAVGVMGITPVIIAQLLVAGLLSPVNFLATQNFGFR